LSGGEIPEITRHAFVARLRSGYGTAFAATSAVILREWTGFLLAQE
jgi:hypothetical protein